MDSGGTLAVHNPKIKVNIKANEAAYLESLSYYCLHNMYIFYTILQRQFTLSNFLLWEVKSAFSFLRAQAMVKLMQHII